jgi:transposase-like protein
VIPTGKSEHLEVPCYREGRFVTEVIERYERMTVDAEEAVLEVYPSGTSVRKLVGTTDALIKTRAVNDVVSRTVRRLEQEQRGASLGGEALPLPIPDRHPPEGSPGGYGS